MSKKYILIVCPSPSFQRVMYFHKFVSGSVNRAMDVRVLASGKGLNSSRAIACLGGTVVNLMFLGGSTGREMRVMLKGEKIRSVIVPTDSNTRSCVTVIHHSKATELIENAAQLSHADEQRFQKRFQQALLKASFVICSGSIPLGITPVLYRQMAKQASAQKVRIMIDAAGEALLKALQAKPWLIKINHLELASTFRISMTARSWIEKGILKAHALGAQQVIVTNSSFVYVSDGGAIQRLKVPSVKVSNTIGAGDVFSGVLAHELVNGKKLIDAARFATACASVGVSGKGYGEFNLKLAQSLNIY